MRTEDLILISVDDHVVEPPDVFVGRVPKKYEDLAPKLITRDDGTEAWEYLGAWSDAWDMEYQILRRVYGKVLGNLPFDLPPYVFAHYREGLWVAVNYTDKATPIPVPDTAEVILGERNLPPAGVLVWREKK